MGLNLHSSLLVPILVVGMNHDFSFPEPGPYDVKLPLHELKRCPLCDAVTAIYSDECFCCGWKGKFINDPVQVAQGLGFLVQGCQILEEQYEPYTFPIITRREMIEMRIRGFFYRIKRKVFGRRRRLDIRI